MRAFLPLLLLLGGCRNDRPPAPSAEESAQLNEADAILDGMGKEEGPEANAPGPSDTQN